MQSTNSPLEISESLIFSVSEVTFHIKQVVETQIEALYIVGEISNFVNHSSGHIYFNLKDDNAVLRCAFFRNQNYQIDFAPKDGDQVVCYGKIGIFEKSGQYQLLVQNMFPYGKGALQQRFEQLKLKLKSEGLFDTEHKKPLPKYPETIGIITSPTGAALQDILNILARRYPCKVLVYPSLMQGDDSPKQVIKGINYFNESGFVDLIIIARGGGSQEDLFCFNDELLAREIYNSELPIVSAIGHEIDFTIADFVADMRAPTPSAAAEMTTPDKTEVENIISQYSKSYNITIRHNLNQRFREIQQHQIRLMQNNPERVWQSLQQRFDTAVMRVMKFNDKLLTLKHAYLQTQKLLNRQFINASSMLVQNKRHALNMAQSNIKFELRSKLQDIRHKLELSEQSLQELSPRKILKRGYALVRNKGKIIISITDIKVNDKLGLLLCDGTAKINVDSIDNNEI
jgi:exodeoxyribonuclease VII large subunit